MFKLGGSYTENDEYISTIKSLDLLNSLMILMKTLQTISLEQ
jgi:hypothetical protein